MANPTVLRTPPGVPNVLAEWDLHAPHVPQPVPPIEVPPQAPPETPTELPPDIQEPPVPERERTPAGDPPIDPAPTVLRH